MREPTQGEKLMSCAVSVLLNLIADMAHLLILKGVISPEEMASILRDHLGELSPIDGENEELVKTMLEPLLAEFENRQLTGFDH
jgi:hypothetical protein